MKRAAVAIILLLAWNTAPAFGTDQRIGSVKGTKGLVSITRAGKTIPAQIQMPLYIDDVIVTGSDSAVGILLEDETLLSMGPISRLALDKFDFVPAENKYAMRVRMMQGSFVYLSGLLGKLAPHAVQMDTPVGTISMLKQANLMANFPAQ